MSSQSHRRTLPLATALLALAHSTPAAPAIAAGNTPGHARAAHRRRSTFVLLAAATLAGLVLILPAPASAATPDCNAVDFQEACRITQDFSFTDTQLCDAFPVEVTVSSAGMYRPVFAADGSGALTSATGEIRTLATILNPATGRSFTDRNTTTERKTYLPDGSLQIRWTGTLHHIRMDTGERLLHQSGNYSVLLTPDDEFISDASHGHFPSDATFGDEVCPLLAQPA
jgi:hypothetical protein